MLRTKDTSKEFIVSEPDPGIQLKIETLKIWVIQYLIHLSDGVEISLVYVDSRHLHTFILALASGGPKELMTEMNYKIIQKIWIMN
jgi:hypothetical protein